MMFCVCMEGGGGGGGVEKEVSLILACCISLGQKNKIKRHCQT